MSDPLTAGLWASLPIAALIIGADAVIVAANPATETFLNASARSLIGTPLGQRLSFDALMATSSGAGARQPIALAYFRSRCDPWRAVRAALFGADRADA